MLTFREADLYDAITPEDIQRVARRYLLDAQPTVVEYQVAAKSRKG